MIAAICKELILRKDYLSERIDTIYFGGGTPSIIETSHISLLLEKIAGIYNIKADAEITLEANPEDMNKSTAKALFNLGINRISLGVQSFDDKVLDGLNRAHAKTEAIEAIHHLQDSGFSNITIDLIYGIPGQNNEVWQANLAQAMKLDIPHLSCYALTIEENTAFGHWLKSGLLKQVPEIKYEQDYNTMCQYLAKEGYLHYEVSSFARPGFESRHNSSYWQQKAYIGLGPGAHSFNQRSRQYNISHNAKYIKSINNGELPFNEEILSQTQLLNEYILTGLRTNGGIDLQRIEQEFGIDLYKKHSKFIARCVEDNLAIIENNTFILSDKALILADSIIIELMIDK